MKRSIKNLIMCIVVLLMVVSMVFTMYYAKDNIVSDNKVSVSNNVPDKPDNEENKEELDNDNMSEPPEKPDGENSDDIPDKPDEELENIDMEKPSEEMVKEEDLTITWIYYLVFVLESLILSILITYLIMSKFNKKTFKETFMNKDKIIINVLLTVLLTVAITLIDSYITNNYFLDNSSSNENKEIDNSSTSKIETKGASEIVEDTTISSGSYATSDSDTNSLLINGDIDVNISKISVTKTGDSDGGDNTSFYGTNSAILVKGGANVTLSNISVETDAVGANGVFSYGGSATTNNTSSDGTTVTISDSTIATTSDNSGGIMTTGGGKTYANNLTIKTSGTSSAAIRTDRGGGEVVVNGGTYITNGQGSPTVYSTANVSVSNATLLSNTSEGIVIEGKNSVTLDNVVLTDTNSKLNGKSTTYKNIFLYQSMSGDADTGISSFTAKNSTITTNNGDTLYVTNTKATITLENNTFINNDINGNFLRIQKDSWGTSGSNGGEVDLIMKNQKATGNIVVDSISTLSITLESNSYYEGAINSDNSSDNIILSLDDTSSIKLTKDSYITSFTNSDTTNSNIDFNGYTLYVNGNAIN